MLLKGDMMLLNQEITYVNTNEPSAIGDFSRIFYKTLKNYYVPEKDLILLCIGTDRVTGDSFGPIMGYKLSRYKLKGVIIYGTLESPVHAKNLSETIETIYIKHKNPLVVAIDASLGKIENIGCLTIGEGCLKPGLGVNKQLPEIGDIFITGIVSSSGYTGGYAIQNTRLGIVMKMADIAYYGIINGINRIYSY